MVRVWGSSFCWVKENLKTQQAVVEAKKKVLDDLQEEKDLLRKLQLSAEVTYNELQKNKPKMDWWMVNMYSCFKDG